MQKAFRVIPLPAFLPLGELEKIASWVRDGSWARAYSVDTFEFLPLV